MSKRRVLLLASLAVGCAGTAGVCAVKHSKAPPAVSAVAPAPPVARVVTPVPPTKPSALRRLDGLAAAVPGAADLVVLGDSLAAAWPSADLLAARPGCVPFNFGLPGDRIQHTLWRLDAVATGATIVFTTPSGEPFTQALAHELSGHEHLVFACGRYEGIDQRVVEHAATIGTVREVRASATGTLVAPVTPTVSASALDVVGVIVTSAAHAGSSVAAGPH